MVLGTVASARKLAGNHSTTNVSDADLTLGLEYGTSQVNRITGKDNWETDITHVSYKSVVIAAEYYASSYIRDRFGDETNISTEHFDRAEKLLESVANSLASSGGAGSTSGVATRSYRSYPLNPSAVIYRSMYSGQGQELIGTATPAVLG